MHLQVESISVVRAVWVCSLLIAGALAKVFLVRHQTLGRRQKTIASRKCGIPPSYPHKDLLGLDILRESTEAFRLKTFLARQCSLYDQYGSTFTSRYFTKTIINTIEPENIQCVLETEFSHYGIGWRRKDAFEPLLGKSLFQLDGHAWASSRDLVKTAFRRAQSTKFSVFENHVKKLVTGVKQTMNEGGQVDLGPFFVNMAVNLTLEFIHGECPDVLSSDSSLQDAEFFDAICQAGKGCEERWQLGLLWKLRPQHEFYRHVKKVHQYMEKHIDKVQNRCGNGPEGRNDFLATLSGATMDRKALRDEMCMLFIAGADTLACALINLFFLLGSDPLVWEKLRREVAFLKGQPPTLKELKGMQYLNSCIHESLRLLPILPNNSRVATQDTVLPVGGGENGRLPVFVPAGTMVTFSIMALQRSKEQWGMDASEFRPERWENIKPSSSTVSFQRLVYDGYAGYRVLNHSRR